MYLAIKELSQYLNIKPSTLYAWVAQGKIPHVKINRLIRFQKEEIDAWVESFKNDRPKAIPICRMGRSHEDIHALIDRAKREVYNTSHGRPDQDRARKEVDDGAV
jgi:excisionase family DNA binding protein